MHGARNWARIFAAHPRSPYSSLKVASRRLYAVFIPSAFEEPAAASRYPFAIVSIVDIFSTRNHCICVGEAYHDVVAGAVSREPQVLPA